MVDLLKSVDNLHQLFIVSKVEVKENTGKEYDYSTITVTKAEGHKCERCWTIVDEVDEDLLCPRCHNILKK